MKLLKFISATLSAAIVALVFSAINAHSAVDRVCNYTVGSTTTATGFANCTEEIGDLATKAFAIAATVSGTNDIEVTSAPVVTTLTDGQMVVFTAANTITGAATFKLDGTTARSLYQLDGTTALGSGDIVAGARYILSYKASNTRWLLMGEKGTGAAPAAVPYLTVGTTASLALERAIAPDGTTITGTDGGANGSYGLSVTTNGIGNAQLRQGTATSVIGRSANSTGNVADIAASADGQFLQRSSAALTWAVPTATQITNTGAGNIAASTVQAAINELDTEKQPLDATLTAWAAFNTNGLLTQTSADTFTGRTLTGPAAGITVSNGNGVSGNPTLALANDLAALEGLASTGFAVRSGTDTWVQRSLTAPAAGLTISNNDGVSGAPTFALANDLAAYEGLSTTGIVVRSATDTALTRAITGTANEITVANGDGVAGAPTLSLPTALTFTGKTVTGGTFSGPGITTPGAGITFAGSTSGTTTLAATATAGTTALTLPAATDTLVGKATTDTLTNKTFDTAGAGNNFSIAGVAVTANTGTGAVVRASSPTLTTPNLGTPSALTLTNATGLPTTALTGALQAAQFPALTGDVTTVAGNLSTTIAANAVALTTDTTGNYVADVADGTGIDGTASGEGTTYTPTLDLTEVNSATWGAGAFTGFTFNAGAVDISMALTSGELQFNAGGTSPIIGIDDGGEWRFYEEDAGGSNYSRFIGPATLAANFDCQIQADGRIPDSCVGDGSDAGAGGGSGDVIGPASSVDNAIVRMDGTTGKIVQESPVIIEDTGEVNLPLVTTPATPATDTLNVYARKKAGRMMIGANGPSGLDHLVQPHIANNKVGWWNPPGNATTVPGVVGFAAPTALGTVTARNVASTNMITRTRRLGWVSNATAAAFAGHYNGAAATQFTIGDGAGLGGFYYSTRFTISDAAAVSGARMFVGLRNSTGVPGNNEPNTLTNVVGVCDPSASANLHICYGGSAAQTAIDLGANFPDTHGSANLYELTLYAPPLVQEIYYEVVRLNTGDKATGTLSGTVGTVIPDATTFLGHTAWRTNNATLLAVGLDVVSIYIETDN